MRCTARRARSWRRRSRGCRRTAHGRAAAEAPPARLAERKEGRTKPRPATAVFSSSTSLQLAFESTRGKGKGSPTGGERSAELTLPSGMAAVEDGGQQRAEHDAPDDDGPESGDGQPEQRDHADRENEAAAFGGRDVIDPDTGMT